MTNPVVPATLIISGLLVAKFLWSEWKYFKHRMRVKQNWPFRNDRDHNDQR